MSQPFTNENEIAAVVAGFETCTTAKDEFRHRDHLTVAVWYLHDSTPPEAITKMRVSLHRFLDYHSIDPQKYKEDVTVAWIEAIHELLSGLEPETSLVDATNIVHERFADQRIGS